MDERALIQERVQCWEKAKALLDGAKRSGTGTLSPTDQQQFDGYQRRIDEIKRTLDAGALVDAEERAARRVPRPQDADGRHGTGGPDRRRAAQPGAPRVGPRRAGQEGHGRGGGEPRLQPPRPRDRDPHPLERHRHSGPGDHRERDDPVLPRGAEVVRARAQPRHGVDHGDGGNAADPDRRRHFEHRRDRRRRRRRDHDRGPHLRCREPETLQVLARRRSSCRWSSSRTRRSTSGATWAICGTRIGRKQNYDFTIGGGTTLPFGVQVQASLGKTAAATNAITFDEVIDLYHSRRRQPTGTGRTPRS